MPEIPILRMSILQLFHARMPSLQISEKCDEIPYVKAREYDRVKQNKTIEESQKVQISKYQKTKTVERSRSNLLLFTFVQTKSTLGKRTASTWSNVGQYVTD